MTRLVTGRLAAGFAVWLLLLAAGCTASTPNVSGGSELPEEVRLLPAAFYQAVSAEPGQNFDLEAVRSMTVDPLQTAVVQDLEQTGSQKSPQAFYRYRDIQVLGGVCTGQGDNRVCEVRAQRAFDASDAQGNSPGGRNDTRVFRAKPVGGQWKLFDTQVDGRWLSDLAAGGTAPTPGG